MAAGLSAVDDLGPNFHLLMSLDHYDDFKVLNFHGRRQIVNLMDEKSILRLFALQCTENIVSSIISHIRFRLALYVNYD